MLRDVNPEEQRAFLENAVVEAVNSGQTLIATATDHVKKRLLEQRKGWATIVAYDRLLWKKVYNALNRACAAGRIAKGPPSGKFATWAPIP